MCQFLFRSDDSPAESCLEPCGIQADADVTNDSTYQRPYLWLGNLGFSLFPLATSVNLVCVDLRHLYSPYSSLGQ